MCWMCDELDVENRAHIAHASRCWWKPWTWLRPSGEWVANGLQWSAHCQCCGRMICFDDVGADDCSARAYTTCAGDLYCCVCGPSHEPEADEDEDWYDYSDPIPTLGQI